MPSRSILTVPVRKLTLGPETEEQDWLAVEEPLQIRIGSRNIAITMRTPGQDADLAAGFLFTEGIVKASQIENIACSRSTAVVTLVKGVAFDPSLIKRNFYISSSCGVCGKASIDAIESAGGTILPRDGPRVSGTVIRSLPAKLRAAQQLFDRTGGVHACGLFTTSGDLLLVREDVGRHNAVDKIVGRAYLDNHLPLSNKLLLLSGRISFELVQKSVMAGIPILAAVGAPSSLAVKTALRFGITLIGFLRDDRYNVYTAPSRLREEIRNA